MLSRNWLAILVLAAGALAGCDSRDSGSGKTAPTGAPTTAPATQPDVVATVPATQPAATQPATSQLMIDGQLYRFPVARLRVNKASAHVVGRLYSDDPKSALDDDYKGNSYDLLMRLDDIQDPQQVYMAAWQYKAPSREYVNAPYGIFLDGMKYQLQPLDVNARFLGTMFTVQISLDGQFLMFDDADKSGPPRVVYVKGLLLAPVEYKD